MGEDIPWTLVSKDVDCECVVVLLVCDECVCVCVCVQCRSYKVNQRT